MRWCGAGAALALAFFFGVVASPGILATTPSPALAASHPARGESPRQLKIREALSYLATEHEEGAETDIWVLTAL
jgi:hypothetical protein